MYCKCPYSVNGVLVRCRTKCLPCQITYRRAWGLRIMHESVRYPSSSFVTFTYDDDHLPADGSLHKDHMQKFFRDLRYDLKSTNIPLTLPDGKIKYFVAGEYGDKNFRPHYHAIIFGLNPNNRDTRDIIMSNWTNCDWMSLDLNKAFGSVTRQSAEYVAGYIHTRYSGSYQKKMYQDNGLVPPYSAKSIGIGKEYALTHARQIIERGYILSDSGKKLPVPQYYYDLLVRNPRKKDIDNEFLHRIYEDIAERILPTFQEQKDAKVLGLIAAAEQFTLSRRGSNFHS